MKTFFKRQLAIALSLIMLVGASVAVLAEPLPQSRKGQAADPPVLRRGNPCAAYGPGFVQAAGSSTCIKLGGKVEFEAGARRGQHTLRSR